MAQECVPEALESHPATDALVWIVLGQIEPATASTLAEETRRSRSAVNDALRRLSDSDMVEQFPHPTDGRKPQYRRAISGRDLA